MGKFNVHVDIFKSMMQKELLLQFGITYLGYTLAYCARKPFSVVKTEIKANMGDHYLNIDTLFLFTYAIGMFIFVTPAEKFGVKRSLALCYCISAICLLCFALIDVVWCRYVFWGLNGLAQSVTFPLYSKILVPWLNIRQRGPYMGIWTTSQQVGGIIAYMLFGYIRGLNTGDASITWVFITSACITFSFAFIVFSFAKDDIPDVVLESIRVENEKILTNVNNAYDDTLDDENLLHNQSDLQSHRESRLSFVFDPFGGTRPSANGSSRHLPNRPSIKLGSSAIWAASGSHYDGNVCISHHDQINLLPQSASFASGVGDLALDSRQSFLENGSNTDDQHVNDQNKTTTALSTNLIQEENDELKPQETVVVVNLLQIVKSVPYLFHTSTCLFMVKLVRYMWLQWIVTYMETLGLSKSAAPWFSTIFDIGAIFGAIICGFVTTRLLKNQRALSACIFTLLTALSIFILSFANPHVSYTPRENDANSYNAHLEVADGQFYFLMSCVVLVGVFLAGPDSLLGSPVPADLVELSIYGATALGPTTGFIHGLGALGAVFQNYVIKGLMGRDPIGSKISDWRTVWFGQCLILAFGALVFIPVIRFFLKKAQVDSKDLCNKTLSNSPNSVKAANLPKIGYDLSPASKKVHNQQESDDDFHVEALHIANQSSSSSSCSSSTSFSVLAVPPAPFEEGLSHLLLSKVPLPPTNEQSLLSTPPGELTKDVPLHDAGNVATYDPPVVEEQIIVPVSEDTNDFIHTNDKVAGFKEIEIKKEEDKNDSLPADVIVEDPINSVDEAPPIDEISVANASSMIEDGIPHSIVTARKSNTSTGGKGRKSKGRR